MQRPRRGLAVLAQGKGPEIGEARIGSRHGGRMRRRMGRVKGVGDRAYGTRRTFKDRAEIPSRLREIGRASCRDRVCQYVETSVVDVYFTKNIKVDTVVSQAHQYTRQTLIIL